MASLISSPGGLFGSALICGITFGVLFMAIPCSMVIGFLSRCKGVSSFLTGADGPYPGSFGGGVLRESGGVCIIFIGGFFGVSAE